MSTVSHLPGYNNLSDTTRGFMDSRNYVKRDGRPILEQYQRLADAWGIDVETLYPDTYRNGIAKCAAFREYHYAPKEIPANPLTVDDVLTGTPASWKKKIAEWTKAKAAASFPTALAEAPLREIEEAATAALQGQEAFEHLLSVIDVDQALRDVQDAWQVRSTTTTLDDNIDAAREQWNTAYNRLLWLDVVLPDALKPSLFTGVTELPVLREVVNRETRETASLFTDEEYAKHAEVMEWRNAYNHVRDNVNRIPAKDNAVHWLVSGDLKLSLDIAKDWATIEKRAAKYAAAGSKTREDYKPEK